MFKLRWRTWWHRLIIFAAPRLAYLLVRLTMWSCRVKVIGAEHLIVGSQHYRCIFALWHNRLLLAPYFHSHYAHEVRFAAMVSKSRDGQLIATLVNQIKNGRAIRVAHTSRHQALKEVIRALKQQEVVVITPDGPRGPLYEVKPGLLFAATVASAKIIPMSWTASRFWQLGTWDKMMVPKPFSRVVVTVGEPFFLLRPQSDLDWLLLAKKVKEKMVEQDEKASLTLNG